MLYEFTFVIDGADVDDDELVTALSERLDASVARGAGVDLLMITADGTHAVDAARNAIRSVHYIAPQINFLYLDRDLVGISEIAKRTGRSRQNVSQWVQGERHVQQSPPFPKVEGVVGRARIWLWSEVNSWLETIGLSDPNPSPMRHEITDINFMILHKELFSPRRPIAGIAWPSVQVTFRDYIAGALNPLADVFTGFTTRTAHLVNTTTTVIVSFSASQPAPRPAIESTRDET